MQRIYGLKVLLLGLGFASTGVIASLYADTLDPDVTPHLALVGLRGIADVLLVAGAIGIAVEFLIGRDKEAAETERIRLVMKEMAPEFRDAVIDGFANTPASMRGVATDGTLDKLATNALALRLGDEQFASEIYADLRDQAIKASERWYDLDVSIRLSSAIPGAGQGSPRFEVLAKWEYTTTPSASTQRFACVSDKDEFRDLITERPSTIPWLMPSRPGFVANAPESFELLEYRVDGDLRPIRRSARKTGQTYTASIGENVVRAGKPVRISYLYRTIADTSLHRMFFELTQPTRGLKLEMDYTDTDIARMSVTDLVSTNEHTRVSQLPEELEARVLSVDLPGWLLPRAGFAFVWTLRSELPEGGPPAATDDVATHLGAA